MPSLSGLASYRSSRQYPDTISTCSMLVYIGGMANGGNKGKYFYLTFDVHYRTFHDAILKRRMYATVVVFHGMATAIICKLRAVSMSTKAITKCAKRL